MMVAMTAMLVSVAELSNIFSVLAVLICFCAMVLFIMRNMMVFRLHGDDIMFGSSVHHVQQQIPQMKMMKVHIPFTFRLTDASKSAYTDWLTWELDSEAPRAESPPPAPADASTQDNSTEMSSETHCPELQCVVSSQAQYSLQALWGVSIRELHLFLWRPWNSLHTHMHAGTMLQGHYQHKGDILHKTSHGNDTLTLSLPQPGLNLGTPPRLCYPLVIFLVRNDPRPMQPDETVALINVVHIKDSVCTLPTSILAQYLKQANGQLSCLKQLYLATGNPLSYDDEPAPQLVCTPDEEDRSVWTTSGEQLCVVCQYFPLSRALLPCRHTCICASCFSKLDRCPMCRSPIRSYFCIRSEEYMPSEPCTPTTKPPPVLQWLQDINDRLTDLLGFQR